MRQKKPARVVGPYQEETGFRVVVVEYGHRTNYFAKTEVEAHELRTRLERQLGRAKPRLIGKVLNEWLASKIRSEQCNATTAEHQRTRIRGMFGELIGSNLAALTPKRAEALYEVLVDETHPRFNRPLAAATHRKTLAMARSFFAWAVSRGYIRSNPFAEVEAVGRPKRGKPQLRIDEARKFVGVALAYYEHKSDGFAVGAVAALLLGLRVSEVVLCRVRDLDDGGRVLWIDGTKTATARRRLAVPEVLRPYLLRLAESRGPLDFLFGEVRPGQPRPRASLWIMVRRLCALAEIPIVCPHSLRGLFATLAVESGEVTHAVASALGHTSFAVTRAHYAQEDAIESARATRALGALNLGRKEDPELN